MHTPTRSMAMAAILIAGLSANATAQYPGWSHSGSVYLLTTPEGANLPASCVVENFPVLVRLDRDSFDFAQAKPDGSDIRFASSEGVPLTYQIEDWDAAKGRASVWVRVPIIRGNAAQELKLHWGKADAVSESNGSSVFGESNGYASVWHMGDPIRDEVGTLTSKDVNTTSIDGMIGRARHLAGGQGIFGGDKIPNYPSGGSPHSTEAWFRAERSNATIIGWGNEGGGRGSKVRMQFRSPPHLHIDSDFSDVNADSRLPMNEWVHVVHTYGDREGKIYINGKLDGASKPTLNIKSPSRLWIGGWYDNYDFIGDIDEVRVSRVVRSADWIRLQFENQKPMQTLVGSVVGSGREFSVSHDHLTVAEGKSATVSSASGGALKTYWILKRDGGESIASVDRSTFTFDAGRVVGDRSATLQFKAVYADGVKTKDVSIAIKEEIPEPMFQLKAPASWNGRDVIEIVPEVSNLAEMKARGAGTLNARWSVSGIAVIKEVADGKLILKRSQNSGDMVVTLTLGNGGAATMQTATIHVKEPEKDAWIPRTPGRDEVPQDHQFYARDDRNTGTLACNGTLKEPADSVFLKLYADGKIVSEVAQNPAADRTYALSVKLKPGLIKYRVEFGTKTRDRELVLHTATDIVCGDVYLINGQSNAVATDVGKDDPKFSSEWIRTFGSPSGSPEMARVKLWTNAVCRSRDGEKGQVGYWGLDLARRLVESHKIPICIINGAVGGTRIDQHQRNPQTPDDVKTIYGRLLWRVREAGLTHGVRGILWHQGENDQGADGPTGRFGWEDYRENFINMAAGWKQDFPNVQNYTIFQIWPKACSMGVNGSDNVLREVQRTLPANFAHMSIMSTLGIKPPGGCHFSIEGYAEFARLIAPLIERDNYNRKFAESITPPNLVKAEYSGDNNDGITLEFDQPVVWNDALVTEFTLDGIRGKVASGTAEGKALKLKLREPSKARDITYLDSENWKESNLLYGTNKIAALTFCKVPIGRKAK